MRVVKFGGTSVGDGERIARAATLIAARRSEKLLIVVSAMAGVTDLLVSLSRAALSGDRASTQEALTLFETRHREALAALDLPAKESTPLIEAIQSETKRLADLSHGVSLLGELPPRISDGILASGELLSSRLFAAALRVRRIAASWIDPLELVATDASYGGAVPDEPRIAEQVRRRAAPELAAGRVPVTGGFVGAAPDGSATTLGRGGSDYSAALLGAGLLEAGEPVEAIEIWSDVDGILTADPRVVAHARLVPEVSYAEAAELAFFGAKVLHPATIRPAVARGVPVVVRNTFRPKSPGTIVRRDASGSGVRALAARKGAAALFVRSPGMLLAHGFAARVFGVFETLRVPVDVIATSEVSISITVEETAPLEELLRELSKISEVSVLRNLAVVSVVGKGLRTTAGIAARIFGALREINVVLISQGASDTNLTFVVAADDAGDAVRRLHVEFFEDEPSTGKDPRAPAGAARAVNARLGR